jgi:hypothetical protein
MMLSTCFDLCSYGLVWIETKQPFFHFCEEGNLYRLFYERPRVQRIKKGWGERHDHKL